MAEDKPFKVYATEEEYDADLAAVRAKAERKARTDVKAVTPAELEELERLRTSDRERAQKDLEDKRQYEAAKAKLAASLKAEFEPRIAALTDEKTKLATLLRTHRIREQIMTEASKTAVDPEEVADLLERSIELDEDYTAIVRGKDGHPIFKGEKPISIKDYVSEFLNKRPHLQRPTSMAEGSGARGSQAGGAVPGGKVAEALKAWNDAREVARKSGSNFDMQRSLNAQQAYERAQKESVA